MKKPLRRSLLYTSLLVVVILSVLLTLAGLQIHFMDMLRRYQSYAGDAINYLARCVDVDDLETCIRTGEKSEEYHRLQRLANELKESYELEYIYIVKPLKIEPPHNIMDVLAATTQWELENEPDTLTDLGVITEYLYPAEVAAHYMARMDSSPAVTFFRNDTDFGRVYTAIRPLLNSQGEPVAVICGDMPVDDIYASALRYALSAGIIGVLFTLVVLWMMNLWYARRIVGPIDKLQEAARKFEDKCSHRAEVHNLVMDDPHIHTGDEIEALSNAIISMVQDVQAYAKDLVEKDNEINSMQEYVNEMDILVYRDPLTGAGNKAAYENCAKKLEWDVLTGNARFALVMADINYLKRINDTYGHDRGNEYILGCYAAMRKGFGDTTIYRIGGDEFVTVLQDDDIAHCRDKVNAIRESMRKMAENKALKPWERASVAFGWAIFQEGDDVDIVFRRADQEMYLEKKRIHAER